MIITIVRTLILYCFVTVAVRLMGKRQIGDMQPGELAVTLLISEIAAIPLQDTTQPVLNGIVAIFVLVVLEITVSILVMKCTPLRRLLNGNPIIVIRDGKIDEMAMRRVRITVLDLIEMLHEKDIFDVSDVAFAVLEVNGELSVVLKAAYRTVQVNDLKIKAKPEGLPLPVISDGKLVKESLEALNIKESAVYTHLGNTKVSDVFLMTLDEFGNCRTVKKEAAK